MGFLFKQSAHIGIESIAENLWITKSIANGLPVLVAHRILMTSSVEFAGFDCALDAEVASTLAIVVLVQVGLPVVFDYFRELVLYLIFHDVACDLVF